MALILLLALAENILLGRPAATEPASLEA